VYPTRLPLVGARPVHEAAVTHQTGRSRFDALYREHVPAIAAYCRGRTRSLSDAEDAVAEVFLIAWRRLDDVPADKARTWLYATARRVLANQARGTSRRHKLTGRLATERPDDRASDDPLTARVHEALSVLGPRDREILLLAEWESLSPAEIAETLGELAVTIRVRLHRARARFRLAFEALPSANDAEGNMAWSAATGAGRRARHFARPQPSDGVTP
jgi:RNA polymerase sigma factor (sigma-70 family)